jgi:RimJ/RimL family protein N-acetyltransferase
MNIRRVTVDGEPFYRASLTKNGIKVAYIDFIPKDRRTLYLAYGYTDPRFRRKGYITELGKKLAAGASLLGFKHVTFIASNVNKMAPGNRPPSAKLANKANFYLEHTYPSGAENRSRPLTMRKKIPVFTL